RGCCGPCPGAWSHRGTSLPFGTSHFLRTSMSRFLLALRTEWQKSRCVTLSWILLRCNSVCNDKPRIRSPVNGQGDSLLTFRKGASYETLHLAAVTLRGEPGRGPGTRLGIWRGRSGTTPQGGPAQRRRPSATCGPGRRRPRPAGPREAGQGTERAIPRLPDRG